MFANWEEVFESFSEIEKDKIRAQVTDTCGQEAVSDENICANVEEYFDVYVGIVNDGTSNCFGNMVPDVVNGHWVYSRENFLWALS